MQNKYYIIRKPINTEECPRWVEDMDMYADIDYSIDKIAKNLLFSTNTGIYLFKIKHWFYSVDWIETNDELFKVLYK